MSIHKNSKVELISDVNSYQPTGDKLLTTIPSKTGEHFIVKPFDVREFGKKYPTLEIKKDNPTNIYIS